MKKKIIIIVSLLLLYGIIMFVLFRNSGNNNTLKNESNNSTDEIKENEENKKYLVISVDSSWMFQNNKWSKVTKDTIQNSDKHYKIYDGNNYLGEYKLVNSNTWNIFDDDKNYIPYKEEIFAYSNDFNIKLIRTNVAKITDSDKNYILNNYGNKSFDSLLVNNIVNIDLDGNGQIDKIVCLSNNGLDFGDDKYYNLIYVVLNDNKIILLDENNSIENNLSSIYEINKIINIDNEKYFIIREVKNFVGDKVKNVNHLYKLENETINEIFSD